jgi:Putative prokaryotic signal transducing protein
VLEVLRTNDPVLLSFASAVLADAEIEFLVADQHISALEGSIGIFPRRLLVSDDLWRQARRLLCDAGIEADLLAPEAKGWTS